MTRRAAVEGKAAWPIWGKGDLQGSVCGQLGVDVEIIHVESVRVAIFVDQMQGDGLACFYTEFILQKAHVFYCDGGFVALCLTTAN